jgi:hypothetical protein
MKDLLLLHHGQQSGKLFPGRPPAPRSGAGTFGSGLRHRLPTAIWTDQRDRHFSGVPRDFHNRGKSKEGNEKEKGQERHALLAHGGKEQTPSQVVIAAATGLSRWTFRCLGHTSSEALRL